MNRCRVCILTIFSLILTMFSHSANGQSPDELPGLTFWLRSDQGLTVSGTMKVGEWQDLSGQDHHAEQVSGTLKPTLIEDVLNGYPVVNFDGFNDYMTFPEVDSIRTAFWIIREDGDATSNFRSLLGHSNALDFIRGSDQQLWNIDFSSADVLNGSTRINFQDVVGYDALLPDDFAMVSLVTTGNTKANQLTLDRSNFGRVWDGDIVEIICYREALTEEQIGVVENYLADRYTTPFYVDDPVVVEYGFCDTTICAAPGFESYLWSSGETTSCIAVNSTDEYIVEATDRFGRIHEDTIPVQFPGYLEFVDQTICLGDDYTFNTLLPVEDYTFLWADESTDNQLTVMDADQVNVQVTDTLGCTIISDVAMVSVDSLSVALEWPATAELCVGNTLSINTQGYSVESYLWSNDSTTASIPVYASGTVEVSVTDVYGCVFNGSTEVVILGDAPQPGWIQTGSCAGTEIMFTYDGQGDPIASYTWWWDGDAPLDGPGINILENDYGIHILHVQVVSDAGCVADSVSTIYVDAQPVPDFDYWLACRNAPLSIYTQSTISEGEIDAVTWEVNGENYTGNVIGITVPDQPNFDLSMTVTSDLGCAATLNTQIETLASPMVSFAVEGVCLGDLTEFTPTVDADEAGGIANYTWDFGDENGSFAASPQHFYTQAGVFAPQVTVTANNGCLANAQQSIEIFHLPTISLLTDSVCSEMEMPLMAAIDFQGDSEGSILWNIESIGLANGNPVAVSFSQTGMYDVIIAAESASGCAAQEITMVDVIELESLSIDVSQLIGLPPLEVQFSAVPSDSGLDLLWTSADGGTGAGDQWWHTFEEEGVFEVNLLWTNSLGCFSEEYVDIHVTEPFADLRIEEVYLAQGQMGTEVSAWVVNDGNYVVHEITMHWNAWGESAVSENWSGTLQPGESFPFTFTSQSAQWGSDVVLCVRATEANAVADELTPVNNEKCQTTEASESLVLLSPSPNPASGLMNLTLISDASQEVVIRLHNPLGQLVFESSPQQLQEGLNPLTIDVSTYNAGHYVLSISSGSEVLKENVMVGGE
ncbi:MAG: PKD domain-containing protein [Flavobacteriales bacterium]|nr:PKD domain-containing protein [Flavobacteriales bacterium]